MSYILYKYVKSNRDQNVCTYVCTYNTYLCKYVVYRVWNNGISWGNGRVKFYRLCINNLTGAGVRGSGRGIYIIFPTRQLFLEGMKIWKSIEEHSEKENFLSPYRVMQEGNNNMRCDRISVSLIEEQMCNRIWQLWKDYKLRLVSLSTGSNTRWFRWNVQFESGEKKEVVQYDSVESAVNTKWFILEITRL